MILTFRKNSGQVAMLGQLIENETLSSLELPDDPRMKQGYLMKIKEGVIEYEKPWWMLDKEKEEAKNVEFTQNLEEINKAKSVEELKPLLIKLLNK